ncbi:MAG: death-on-curing protein [Asticcacaulis sp.]
MAYTLLGDGVIEALQGEIISEHGGLSGLKNPDLLHMVQARVAVLNESAATDLASLATCYGYALAHDELFHGANLATALVAIELFLRLNGHVLMADDMTCCLGLLVVGQGELSAEGFAHWIRDHIAEAAPSPAP